MMVDRDYIFTLYQMGVGVIFRYLQQIERRVEDGEVRAASSHGVRVELLAKELASTKRTLLRKSKQLLEERQLNHHLQSRIRELEREIECATAAVERDSHNSSLPPSLDPPWKKVLRTRSLRQKTGMKVGGQPGHQGRTLRQVARPDEVITHAPEVCRGCGRSLSRGQATGCVTITAPCVTCGCSNSSRRPLAALGLRKGRAPSAASGVICRPRGSRAIACSARWSGRSPASRSPFKP